MARAIQLQAPKSGASRFITGGVVAGMLCAVLNIGYSYLYTHHTGTHFPHLVSPATIVIASVAAPLLAAFFYFVTANCTRRGRFIYAATVAVLTLLSLVGPLSPTLPDGAPMPDGFLLLTLPMHLITGLVCLLVIPLFVRGERDDL